MLKITGGEPCFRHVVTVMTPVDGGHKQETLNVTFRVLPVDEAAKFNLMNVDGVGGFLKRALARIDDVVDERDATIPYSDDVRDQLIALPHVRLALATAYFEAVGKAKEKN